MKVRAQSGAWLSRIEFQVQDEISGTVGTGMLMEKRVDGLYYEPTFTLEKSDAQILMDDLWHAGLRPTEGTGSAGALAATQNHLKDLRKILFKKIGITE